VATESIDCARGTFTTELTEVERPGRDPHVTVRSDAVVALVGYGPDATIYDQLHVQSSYATGGPAALVTELMGDAEAYGMGPGGRVRSDSLRNPEPDFYILGAKSYGTNSNFLMRVGHEQVRAVFELIAGRPPVDLYAGMGACGVGEGELPTFNFQRSTSNFEDHRREGVRVVGAGVLSGAGLH
jgi:hypothetical protein